MFVTMPYFEQAMPAQLVAPNHKHWRAVTLSTEGPWFVLVYLAQYGRRKVPQSTLVAWEATLLDILAGIPEEDCVAIARLTKQDGIHGRWDMQWIDALWQPGEDELETAGIVLLQMEGDSQVRDAHLEPVAVRTGRVLLFQAMASRPMASQTDQPAPDQHSLYPAVPEDFPFSVSAGAVPGAQPKVNVREVSGNYVDDADVRRAERFDVCQDLLNQLIAYTQHKRIERPDDSLTRLVEQVIAQLKKKRFGWGLSPAEAQWLATRVRTHFNANSAR